MIVTTESNPRQRGKRPGALFPISEIRFPITHELT